MLPEELLQKVRKIEITTRKMVDDVLTGNYKSHFKGHGVQFSEHRIYNPGDDIRHIDWKASARTRDPLIKKYDEERELQVFLIVDLSRSQGFGSSSKMKSEMAAEIGGMLAYAASHTGDRVGMLIFSGEVEYLVPPKKGRQHVLRIIRDLLSFQPKSSGTHLSGALDVAGRIMKHRGVVFVISDFIAQDYQRSIKRLARKHDVVAVLTQDEKERSLPHLGHLWLTDPETGEELLVDTRSYAFEKWVQEFHTELEEVFQSSFKSSGVELLRIQTKDDYGEAVVRFFRARARRKR
jgi:uncharacterized protein (DUF58 family)